MKRSDLRFRHRLQYEAGLSLPARYRAPESETPGLAVFCRDVSFYPRERGPPCDFAHTEL